MDDISAQFEQHRRELHVHCYRMLGNYQDAEELVQETFLRAWRKRETFDGGENVRAWLYKIATNACLDAIRARKRRVPSLGSFAEVSWLTPYPDRLLDEIAPSEEQPDAVVVTRESIELTFIAVIQLLPPKQRAAVILRDVLDWSAKETAQLMQTSVAAANSALQRGRATLEERLPAQREEARTADLSGEEQELLAAFIETHMSGDVDAAVAVMHEQIRVTMPPYPFLYDGIAAMTGLCERAMRSGMGEWRLVATRANRMPTAASYLREPGSDVFRAFKLDVLRMQDGKIREATTFGPELFEAFGLVTEIAGQQPRRPAPARDAAR
jgi:RNA polymerase sigma-70 factor (ECF subfamily)